VIEDEHVGADLRSAQIDRGQLAPSHHEPGIGLGPVLNHGIENLHTAGMRQLSQFFQRCVGARQRIFFNPQQNGFIRCINFTRLLFFCKLILQRLNEGKKINFDLVRFLRFHEKPVVSRRIFRNQVRPVQQAR